MAESHAGPVRSRGAQPPRRWLQFGFATLLKLVVLAAILSAWWADRERLTNRIGRLESDQSVLRIAIGDDVEEMPSLYSDPFVQAPTLWTMPGGLAPPAGAPAMSVNPPAPVYYVPAPNATAPYTVPSFGGAPPPAPVAATIGPVSDLFRGNLYNLLKTHEEWLKVHCSKDRGWQEFLTRGPPAPVYPMAPTSAIPELPSQSSAPAPAPVTPASQPQEDPPAKVAQQCLPAVVKLLAGGDVNARRQAAVVLADLGSLAAAAATDLAEAANDPNPGVRQAALNTLATMGPSAKPAAQRLTALMQADDARCRPVEVAYALLRIDPQADVVPPLVESLRGQQGDRAWALEMLSSLNAAGGPAALPAIAELLDDEDPNIRLSAARAYSRLADRHDATETLRMALQSERHEAVKRGMARIIVRLQNAAK